ncbi:hypothetical protein, partial [Roseofilum sp. Guam]|uniref:hypothetical protein n=1 Tax=Roseofilum sp. Guam TaxID=2821502 RepID=UPI001B03E6ED
MALTPKSGLLLALCCIAAIAATGCIFELSSGTPDLGFSTTRIILAIVRPVQPKLGTCTQGKAGKVKKCCQM